MLCIHVHCFPPGSIYSGYHDQGAVFPFRATGHSTGMFAPYLLDALVGVMKIGPFNFWSIFISCTYIRRKENILCYIVDQKQLSISVQREMTGEEDKYSKKE